MLIYQVSKNVENNIFFLSFFLFFLFLTDVESILRSNRTLLKNAQSFVNSVKMALLDEPARFKNFLEGLIKFSSGQWSKDRAVSVIQKELLTFPALKIQLQQILSY